MNSADRFPELNPQALADVRSIRMLENVGRTNSDPISINPFRIFNLKITPSRIAMDLATDPDYLFPLGIDYNRETFAIWFTRINSDFTKSWIESRAQEFLFSTPRNTHINQTVVSLESATAKVRTVDNLKPEFELGDDSDKKKYDLLFEGSNISEVSSVTFSHNLLPNKSIEIENNYAGTRMELSVPASEVDESVIAFALSHHRDAPKEAVEWLPYARAIERRIEPLLAA